MRGPVKVIDIELSDSPATVRGLEGYTALRGLVRLHGDPVGYVEVPVRGGACDAATLRRAIIKKYSWPVIRHLLGDALAARGAGNGLDAVELSGLPHPPAELSHTPLLTVAVCTRDRPDDLALCLAGLLELDYPHLDLLVVDNAPATDATAFLVNERFPRFRYVREDRPGLDWARNRAIEAARGAIIAFTDDDCVVEQGWARALATVFVEHPDVMAVTGLVVPFELETEAQLLFERYGGFGKGFQRRWYRYDPHTTERTLHPHGAGRFGTGANMAYRRELFDQVGPFDPALDVGTVTNGGGDLEMFFRVLKGGYPLVYEPRAIVRHRHRRTYEQLRAQIFNNGIAFYAYLVRCALAYPDERMRVARFAVWWFWWWDLRRLFWSFLRPSRFPRDLILAELRGAFSGLRRYQAARRTALAIARTTNTDVSRALPGRRPAASGDRKIAPVRTAATGIRNVDLRLPLRPIEDVSRFASVRVYIMDNGRLLGTTLIANHYQSISATQLREEIAAALGVRLLDSHAEDTHAAWAELTASVRRRFVPDPDGSPGVPPRLPDDLGVSVVVATYDRAGDLREFLRSLVSQETTRPVEIIVVDNHPASCVTPPVVAEFPGVRLLSEARGGVSYARNAGFVASSGDIIVSVDDDVIVPPGWLEALIAPLAQADVMVVTGNILPWELETPAQRAFERYGGLGRGFERQEFGSEWFERPRKRAVPTWRLGGTANAAYRAEIFGHPEIGLLDEALGPGTPTGVGEDTYLFYKVLKAGYSIVYEPAAYLWHKHRRDMTALRRQIYNYSTGHIAYHLTTLIDDRDLRAIAHMVFVLIPWRLRQLLTRKARRQQEGSVYPLRLVLVEIAGNLAGPWKLRQSRRRVARLGRSGPFPAARDRGRIRSAMGIPADTPELLPPSPVQPDAAFMDPATAALSSGFGHDDRPAARSAVS